MSTGTCITCRYYTKVEAKHGTTEELGECFRYPPTVCGWNEEDDQFQARPFTWASDFCGEFMQRLAS